MPRQVLPQTTYLVTRRTSQRQFLLQPSTLTIQIFLYCLGVAAQKFGVVLHALCVLASHYHLAATDPLGMLPAFEAWLNEFVAKAINASLGRWEALWSPGSYSAQALQSPEDVLGALTYIATNPVKAGLVARGDLWPGINIMPSDLGRKIKVRRPPIFFRSGGALPEEVELEFTAPPGFEHLPAGVFQDLWQKRVDTETQQLQAQHHAAGRRFLGRRAVRKQSPFDCAKSKERRRGLKPRIKCRDRLQRMAAIRRLKEFCAAHREAFELFRAGVRDVVFPAGTYWMRIHAGVSCAPWAPG